MTLRKIVGRGLEVSPREPGPRPASSKPTEGTVMRGRLRTGSRSYVVVRSQLVDPGTPYVVAEVRDWDVASWGRSRGAEVLGRGEMAGDPELAGALDAWETGDDLLLVREQEAVHRIIEAAFTANSRIAAGVAGILGAAGMISEHGAPESPARGGRPAS